MSSGSGWIRRLGRGQPRLKPDRSSSTRPTGAIACRFQAALDVFGDGRAIHPGAPGDRGYGEALSVEIQDHEKFQFPECDHRRLPFSLKERMTDGGRPALGAYAPGPDWWVSCGKFSRPIRRVFRSIRNLDAHA